MKHWRHEKDAQGLVWLTFDRAGESTNTFSKEAIGELSQALDEIAGKAAFLRNLGSYPIGII